MRVNNEALCFRIKKYLRIYRDGRYMCRFSRIAIDCVCIRVVALYGIVSSIEANDDRIVVITDCRFNRIKKALNSVTILT